MDFAEYQRIDAINFSALKSMRKSPKQFWHDLNNRKPDSTGKLLGRGAHTAILEPDRLQLDYHVFPGKTRRGKDWDAFVDQHGSENILKKEEYNKLITVRDAVRNHPVASRYLSKGKAEHTIVWNDRVTGLKCKARIDFLSEVDDTLTIVDLKGCRDVRSDIFRVEAGRMGYHMQLAWYREGIATLHDGLVPNCNIIAVEHIAPHDVAVFKMDEDALYAGAADCADMLQRVATCRIDNTWPGVYATEQDLTIRKWDLGLDDESTDDLDLEFEPKEEE